jgi:hypothetical protein
VEQHTPDVRLLLAGHPMGRKWFYAAVGQVIKLSQQYISSVIALCFDSIIITCIL